MGFQILQKIRYTFRTRNYGARNYKTVLNLAPSMRYHVFHSVHSWMVQFAVVISLSEGQTFEVALVISHSCLGCWFLALNLPISFHCIRLPEVLVLELKET